MKTKNHTGPEGIWYKVRFGTPYLHNDFDLCAKGLVEKCLFLEHFNTLGKSYFKDKEGKLYLIPYNEIYSMYPATIKYMENCGVIVDEERDE